MKYVFISYRRADSDWVTRALWEALNIRIGKENLFMDIESIRLGKRFPEKIDQALLNATHFLIMIGPDWTSIEKNGTLRLFQIDDYVRLEVEYAVNSKKPVIPVLIDDTEMPSSSELPPSLHGLRQFNALPLSHERMRGDVDRLQVELGIEDKPSDNVSIHQETHGDLSPAITSEGPVTINFNNDK